MVSIILASPNPLQVHQHYLCTSPEVYLGPQSNELAQILYSLRTALQELLLSWKHHWTFFLQKKGTSLSELTVQRLNFQDHLRQEGNNSPS